LPEPSAQPTRPEETERKSQIFACKSIDKLIAESEKPEMALKKTLGPVSLTALGIGAVIGSGIFTVIGTAIAGQHFATASIENTPLIDYFIRRWWDGRDRVRRWHCRWCWWQLCARSPGCATRSWRR